MSRIELLETDCQDILHGFALQDRIKYTFMAANQSFTEAVGSRILFDPFEAFAFLEDLNADTSQGRQAILDYVYRPQKKLLLPIIKGLEPYIPFLRDSKVSAVILASQKEADLNGEIPQLLAIIINQLLPDDLLPAIYHDKLIIYSPEQKYRFGWSELPAHDQASVDAKRERAMAAQEQEIWSPPGSPGIPGRDTAGKPGKSHLSLVPKKARMRSVGRSLKLAFLPAELLESPNFRKLSLGAQEIYRIHRTYAKIPGGGSKYRYIQVGIAQITELFGLRKREMMMSGTSEQRKKVARMGVSERSVKRHLTELVKSGWLYYVLQGYPGIPGNSKPRVNKFLVIMSENQRIYLIEEAKKKEEDI